MNIADVLSLVKIRLNRPPGDTALDEYFTRRIEAAIARLEKTGIHLTGGALGVQSVTGLFTSNLL